MTNSHKVHATCVFVAAALLTGCVSIGAHYTASPDAAAYTTKAGKDPGEIIVSETAIAGHRYKVIGSIESQGRSLNLLSPAPTREDLDKSLRVEAAKRGADAVINVEYQSQREGLASHGKMTATGQAVVFTD